MSADPGGRDDPDRALWEQLAASRRTEERDAQQRGLPELRVRRLAVDDPQVLYPRALFTLALNTTRRTVVLYMAGRDRIAVAECSQAQALAVFINADPADTGAQFTVAGQGDEWTVACEGVAATIGRRQRAEVVAFLM